MYRTAMKELHAWKTRVHRKPLIIRGARQVGKTWIMKEFGREAFDQTVYINFENNSAMQSLFASDLNVDRLLLGLELYIGHKIDPKKHLLVFDEVQEVPKALTALKYFQENLPEYPIICAGSLLGVALHQGTSFPVGKVEFLDLYPLNFQEFLLALGKDQYLELLQQRDFGMIKQFRENYIELLKYYYYVGGMPEAVQRFSENQDFVEVRQIQERILSAYEQDFSKHAPLEVVPRIRMLWNSIPSQLAKENRKFIYGLVREGSRAKEYELALLWLVDCGLVHKIHRTKKPDLPLKAYVDEKAFKLFLLDVGLLSCMTRLSSKTLLEENDLFTEFKGALTEQYVLQQLMAIKGMDVYYWTNERGGAEIDFLLDDGTKVIPLEVKAERNLKAKSLRYYREKYQPLISIRSSMADYQQEEWLVNLPLYAVGITDEVVK